MLFSFFTTLLLGCSPTPKEKKWTANFEASLVTGTQLEVEKDEWGLPKVIRYTFNTCINSLSSNEPIHGQTIEVKNATTTIASGSTNSEGCFFWNEDFTIHFLSGEQTLRLHRSLVGSGHINGKVDLDLAINPWRDQLNQSNGHTAIRDLSSYTLSKNEISIGYDDYQKLKPQKTVQLHIPESLQLTSEFKSTESGSQQIVGEIRGSVFIKFVDQFNKEHLLRFTSRHLQMRFQISNSDTQQSIISQGLYNNISINDSRFNVPISENVLTPSKSTKYYLNLTLTDFTKHQKLYSNNFIFRGQSLSSQVHFFPVEGSKKVSPTTPQEGLFQQLELSEVVTEQGEIIKEERDLVYHFIEMKSCLHLKNKNQEKLKKKLEFFIHINKKRTRVHLDPTTGCFKSLISLVTSPNSKKATKEYTLTLEDLDQNKFAQVPLKCILSNGVKTPCYDERFIQKKAHFFSQDNEDNKNKGQDEFESQNTKLYLDRIHITFSGVESSNITNTLNLNLSRQYFIDLKFLYKPHIIKRGTNSRYLPIRDGKYKLTVTFLKPTYQKLPFLSRPNNPQTDPIELYLSSDQQVVTAENGRIVEPFDIEFSRLRTLKTRGYLVIDISPVVSTGDQPSFIQSQRFVNIVELAEDHAIPVILSDHHMKQSNWDKGSIEKLLKSPIHHLHQLAQQQKRKSEKLLLKLTPSPMYAKWNHLKEVSIQEPSGYQSFYKTLYDKTIQNSKLSLNDLKKICQYWVQNLYVESNHPNFNSIEFKNRLQSECLLKSSSLSSNGPPKGFLSQVSYSETFPSQDHPLFFLRAKWLEVNVIGSKKLNDKQPTSTFSIGSQYVSARRESYMTGLDGRVFTNKMLPVIPIGFAGGQFWTLQKEESQSVDAITNNINYLGSETKFAEITINQFKPCIVFRIRPQFLHQIMEKILNPTESWSVKDQGLLICDSKKQLSHPIKIKDSYTLFSQIFKPGAINDPYSLQSQPWVITIRGHQQFEDFKRLFHLKKANQEPLDRDDLVPELTTKKVYEAYKNMELPNYPGVYTPNSKDIQTALSSR